MKRKILLIDDERMQHHLVRQLFTRFTGEQFELEWRDTFEAGLATLLSGEFAACLLDYRLGARDGLELIRAAREAGCRVPGADYFSDRGNRDRCGHAGDERGRHGLPDQRRDRCALARTFAALCSQVG